ncbi:MAG: hypothetical protein LBJ92_02600 [Holosporales bacterium]|jgi:hypothetical protein|nr:hypothetical protein [Holosporales bacterium]
MNINILQKCCITLLSSAVVSFSAISADIMTRRSIAHQFRDELAKFPPAITKICCAFDADGKTQTFGIMKMAEALEERLNHPLHSYINGTLSTSAGTLVGASLVTLANPQDLMQFICSSKSKVITPQAVFSGCGCFFKVKNVISAYTLGATQDLDGAVIQDQYDAFQIDAKFAQSLSSFLCGSVGDLCIPFVDYTLSTSLELPDRVIASITERDQAAKSNFRKMCFQETVSAAKTVAEIVTADDDDEPKEEGKSIRDLTSFHDLISEGTNLKEFEELKDLALEGKDLMFGDDDADMPHEQSTIDQFASKCQTMLEMLKGPDQHNPVFVLRFNADSTEAESAQVVPEIVSRPYYLELSYNLKVPISTYPTKKMPFERISSYIAECATSSILDPHARTAPITELLIEFLNDSYRAHHTPPHVSPVNSTELQVDIA